MTQQTTPAPAEVYEQHLGPAMFIPWSRVLLEHAAPRAGERVLDLACGTGIVARQVAPLVGRKGRVVGVDVSPDMLAVAQSRPAPGGAPIEWREAEAAATGLPDDAFDVVLCQQGLQFFPDRTTALREVRRVLTPGGRVVLSVWHRLDRHALLDALFRTEARHLGVPLAEVAVPFCLGDAEELRALLNEAGFERTRVTPRSLDVRFPTPERFVHLMVHAGAAVISAFRDQDAAARAALIQAVAQEVDPLLQRYRDDEMVRFPMSAHVAVAYA
jgi:ubiquinone/menaquinone biosynthesis C-methylase UbiE